MSYLLDTNILLRLSQSHDTAYQSIVDSIALLQQKRGITLRLLPYRL